MEETVRELKSDLRNARELISCLTENVKAMKPGRDEDLHRKLDDLLSQRENQKELEKKIDSLKEEFLKSREEMRDLKEGFMASREEMIFLRAEIKNVAIEITNSDVVKHLKDSVETCVGYQELFVKDFEKIYGKIQEMKGEFSVKSENLNQKLQEVAREIGNKGNGIKQIERKIDNFERNLEGITENGQNFVDFGKKIEKLEQELKGKIDLISKTLEEMKKNLEKDLQFIILESTETKKEINEKLAEINKKEQNIPETKLKCRNKACNSILPIDLPLREDGVNVKCPKCPYSNIVGKFKEGHKWMYMNCNGLIGPSHFQQFPVGKKEGDKRKCQVCGKEGRIYHANDRMAVPC